MQIDYVGEHLLPGQIGHFLVVLGFTSSILALVAYIFATNRRETSEYSGWRKIGRIAFTAHGLSVFGIIGMIFYMMISQLYEYQYVWAHVSDDLPFKYIFSAFWEGQEGSFLLWMFWHAVLGFVLLFSAKKWESPVMAVLSCIQLFIISMILGVHLGGGDEPFKIGVSPFLLLRDVMEAPIFAKADYVELIDGQGLNPLLQNYWMTIHPPTLFLGFASTSIPFCFAIAGLWTGEHKAWLKPALTWGLFCGAILGTGILMGGAWAYEALSFGGYWAWDPVENMSLVPWMVLLAGIHTNLIARATGYSIKSTYLFYILSFVLIVYSTFLTRSGVLGDTSVHAFTEMGLEWQLVAFILFFLFSSLIAFFARSGSIPSPVREEAFSSKEFWMFLGSLILLFGAILITFSTSLPVYNKIREYFDPTFVGGVINDPEAHYNKYQLWIALLMGLLTGAAQLLRFRENRFQKYAKKYFTHTGAALAISAVLTYLCLLWINASAWQYVLLLFSGIFAVVANLDYLITVLRGNLKAGGSTISHIGFGLMLVGIMASGLNKQFISNNVFAQSGLIEGFSEDDYKRNIVLLKDAPMLMNDYEVTYVDDTVSIFTRTFDVNYKRKDESGNVVEEFTLSPNILYDKSFTKVAASNPSTKRYWNKDIFTHISSLPRTEIDPEFAKEVEDSLNYELYDVAIDDTLITSKYYAILESIDRNPNHPEYKAEEKDLKVGVKLAVRKLDEDQVWYAKPMIVLRKNLVYQYPAQIDDLNLKVRLSDEVLDLIFGSDDQLTYKTYTLKKDETIRLNGHTITFRNFNTQPTHPDYFKEEGDIAVGVMLEVQPHERNKKITTEPIYLIRGNRPFNIKTMVNEAGLHFRFTQIDPKTETVQIQVAQGVVGGLKIPIEVAENSLRTDYIVMEAIVFPGINYFWLGTVMMMLGLGFSTWHRARDKRRNIIPETDRNQPQQPIDQYR